MTTAPVSKIGKNQFKCFHCKRIFAQRDGDWFDWNSMQVHLCQACSKLTAQRPERNQKSGYR